MRTTAGTLVALALLSAAACAQPVPLAWLRVAEAGESYADTPYVWLGRNDLRIRLDVPPAADHRLELLWGSKNDARGAAAEINGRAVTVRGGGWNGFRWLAVEVPAKARTGGAYEIALRAAAPKAAFLAGVRLLGPAPAGGDLPDPNAAAHRATMKATPVARPVPGATEAFGEMRPFWDRRTVPLPEAAGDDATEQAFRDAEANARRWAEMLFRCRRFVDGWLAHADPNTGLIPRNLNRSRDIWNAKDAAADNYPFMVLTCALTDRAMFRGRMRGMLRTETELTSRVGRLPDTWSFSKGGFASPKPQLGRIIFGASEYVKDGLLPLTEWLGESPWSQRMLGLLEDIWANAAVDTPAGAIPSTNVEVNGELLQALSRVYWMTGEEAWLDRACRLGDYYLLGDRHPTRDVEALRLRDHGCEIVSGLSELYVACHHARAAKAKAYRGPVHAMLDRVLEVGRDEHGMLYNTINPKAGTHGKGICDTWGYNYNGVYAVWMIDGTAAYRDAVRDVLGNLHEHLTDHHWGSADEYADTIEGGINLFNREPVASAAAWLDSEIRDMWSRQRPDGVIEGWHGDGNVARTAIMYALWKSAGLTVRPWRKDVRVGAVRRDGTLLVSLASDEPWTGRLVFDTPRHRTQMRLPIDYPRINQFPEWFTVRADRTYRVRDLTAGTDATAAGAKLADGLPLSLPGGREARLIVAPAGK